MEKELKETEENKIIEAFEMMWGEYPFAVMLLKKDRTIVAKNKEAKKQIGENPATQCFQLNKLEGICPGCLGNQMLKEGVAKRAVARQRKTIMDCYWVPTSEKDYYLHYYNDITEYANPELFPRKQA